MPIELVHLQLQHIIMHRGVPLLLRKGGPRRAEGTVNIQWTRQWMWEALSGATAYNKHLGNNDNLVIISNTLTVQLTDKKDFMSSLHPKYIVPLSRLPSHSTGWLLRSDVSVTLTPDPHLWSLLRADVSAVWPPEPSVWWLPGSAPQVRASLLCWPLTSYCADDIWLLSLQNKRLGIRSWKILQINSILRGLSMDRELASCSNSKA